MFNRVKMYEHNFTMQNNLEPTHMDQHEMKQLIHSKAFANDELRAPRYRSSTSSAWYIMCILYSSH